MRLPNGYGSVYKLKGNRRNPWVARKTLDYVTDWEKKTCNPKYKWIGYYRTRAEALEALAKYNLDPSDALHSTMTLQELFDEWMDAHSAKISLSTLQAYTKAFQVSGPLLNRRVETLKLSDFQKCAEASRKNTPILRTWKIVLGQMYEYAVRNEILPREKRELISYIDLSFAGNPNRQKKSVFTAEEIQQLWEIDAIAVLLLIYSGLRISEFLALDKKDVYLDRRVLFVRESKTAAGIREVPIAEKTVPLWARLLAGDGEIVFPSEKGLRYTYANFYAKVWKPLGLNHTIHETRHTFITLLAEAGVDPRIVKQIVGHAAEDVTEGYTHISLEAKLEAVTLI